MKYLTKPFTLALAIAAFIFFAPSLNAQLHVDAQGEVGISTTSPSSRLDIRNTGSYRTAYLSNNYTGNISKYGVYNYVSNQGTGSRYGLYNIIYSNASSSSHFGIGNLNYMYNTGTGYGLYNYNYCYDGDGARYGIYNVLNCGSNCGTGLKYALYSTVGNSCGGTSYAGYFAGDVYISGALTVSSDASKKTNITPMNGALGIISQLKPKTYDYIMDEDLALPQEKQYGFLAQDLEQILPEIVKEVDVLHNVEAELDKDGNVVKEAHPESKGEIKTVNYMALIPILVQGMQEQQKIIAEQKARIDELETLIKR